MTLVIPLAPDAYDPSNEQRARTTIEERLGDLEQQIYELRTTYGTISLGETTIDTLSTGTNSNVPPGYNTFARITEPTGGSFTITGFTDGERGRILILANVTGQQMTLVNDATSTAANRILTNTGGNLVSTGNASAVLVYDGTSERWRVIAWAA